MLVGGIVLEDSKVSGLNLSWENIFPFLKENIFPFLKEKKRRVFHQL